MHEPMLRNTPTDGSVVRELPNVEHNKAGLGNLAVNEYRLNDISVFDVKSCEGVEGAFYPEHIISLIKTPYVMDATWEGDRFQHDWPTGEVVFVPANSKLTFSTMTPYDETVIRLKDSLFTQASKDHIDFSQIDFTLQKVTSFLTWTLGTSLASIVMNETYSDWPLLVESAALSLVISVIKELAPNATTAFKTIKYGLSPTRRRRVMAYINDNISRQISLTELAEIANLSIYHFSRKFKNAMGETPLQYIAHVRVDAAKRQLRATDDSLVNISISCGFASQSHFNTVFKQVTGTTPMSYRFDGL